MKGDKMKKVLILMTFCIIFINMSSMVSALNIEFMINVPDKIFYPNETIPINISIINKETSFTTRNVTMGIYIGKRSFVFKLGDIKASKSVLKNITLPEFPPGDYIIKGQLNYTGFFDERETLETYNSFHVRFPEMKRLPRNIIIKEFSIPQNITAGKSYTISVKISNNGNIEGDILVAVSSLDVEQSKEIHLKSGESKTITLSVRFYNPGISVVEARVYAIVDGIKYLLSFDTANVFVKESKIAKLSMSDIELIDETDNEINQNDVVKLTITLFNNGTWLATNVRGILKSLSPEIEVISSSGDFGVVPKNSVSASTFEIKTTNANIGQQILNLDVSYTDGMGNHSISLEVPLTISEGGESCRSNDDCLENQVCSEGECLPVICECGKVINHQCVKYECCDNLDCEEGYVCNVERHKCEPSQQISVDVLIVTSSRLKRSEEYENILKEYRRTILKTDGLTSFYLLVDSSKVKEIFNVEPANPDDWQSVKRVLDKMIYKIKPQYLLIIGGVDIIPQPPAKTDAKIPTIPVSDDRYVDIDLDGIPDIAGGRIPTPTGNSDENLPIIIKAFTSAIKMHKINRSISKVILADICIFPPSCSGINDVNYISNILFNKNCLETNRCKPAPPYCGEERCEKREEFYQELLNNDLIYMDCHGSPYSFGAATVNGYYRILSSSFLYEHPFSRTPVFGTAACHSGTIDCEEYGCISEMGSVFSFLANGASGYIGSTRYGFSYTSQLIGEIYKLSLIHI